MLVGCKNPNCRGRKASEVDGYGNGKYCQYCGRKYSDFGINLLMLRERESLKISTDMKRKSYRFKMLFCGAAFPFLIPLFAHTAEILFNFTIITVLFDLIFFCVLCCWIIIWDLIITKRAKNKFPYPYEPIHTDGLQ